MCLAIPMQIVELDELVAQCEAKGVRREVSLFMLQDETLEVGDHVLVHVGYAIQKVTPQEAEAAWEIYDGDHTGAEGAGRAVGERFKEKDHV